MNLGGTHGRGSTLPAQNNTEFGLLSELNKRIRELNKTLCCLTEAGSPVPDPGSTATPFTFRYGVGTLPVTSSDILAGLSGIGTHNLAETVSFPNVTDQFLWMAEPVTEPLKTRWYNTDLNQALIGPDELFGTPTIVDTWRLYVTSYATTFIGSTQFRVS